MSRHELLQGLFDLHVHSAPDVVARRFNDRELIAVYEDEGFTGCVLKAHYDSTVGRAALLEEQSKLDVRGGLALNRQVGGFNALAVSTALEMGARVIWFPTEDSWTQGPAGLHRLNGDEGPTYAAPPVNPDSGDAIQEILRLIAERDAVLATGHLSGSEVEWVLHEAAIAGVERVLLTHPSFDAPDIPSDHAAALTRSGAFFEVTAYQLQARSASASRLADYARAVGVSRLILSSDVGQVDSPTPGEAMAMLVRELANQGLDESALINAASERPRGLVLG